MQLSNTYVKQWFVVMGWKKVGHKKATQNEISCAEHRANTEPHTGKSVHA